MLSEMSGVDSRSLLKEDVVIEVPRNASTVLPKVSGATEMVESIIHRRSYCACSNGAIRLFTFGLTPTTRSSMTCEFSAFYQRSLTDDDLSSYVRILLHDHPDHR